MKNLYRVMTHDQAIEEFREHVLPNVVAQHEQDGEPDWIARREAWNDWTDYLCKDKRISDWQYKHWSQSPDCDETEQRNHRTHS